ncbi:MAG: Stp1/IreP family PP2C-type Ser/Thr phosphatase [Thermoleophilia bacterium]|nr:Stp1/IreP family PP2C-type Ser/Thr phosphatase [Thermoleophilia bacterium]
MRLRAGVVSDRGVVRASNEDSYFLRRGLYAVSDGMGGAQAGEVASQMACLALLALDPATVTDQDLRTAVKNANRAIISRSLSQVDLLGMGTTLTAVLIKDNRAIWAHVGDSRAYLYHNQKLTQLTDDHSWVGEMVRRGELTPQQAASHPHRSVITRALGTDWDLEPDIGETSLCPGDRILLCSDGLSNFVAEDEIARILAEGKSPHETAGMLVKAALEAGGDDNVTALVVDVMPDASEGEDTASSEEDEVGDRILVGPPDREWSSFGGVGRRRGAGVIHKLGLKPGSRPSGDVGEANQANPFPAEGQNEVVAEPKRRRFRGRWIATFAIIAVLLVGLVSFAIYNSTVYYVGEYNGLLALYRGIPATVVGIDLSSPVELTSVAYDSLPPYLKAEVDSHRLVSKREGQQFLRTLSILDQGQ